MANLDLKQINSIGTPKNHTVNMPFVGIRNVACYEQNGVSRIEGDIVIPSSYKLSMIDRIRDFFHLGHTIEPSNENFLWPNGVIPYVAFQRVNELVQAAIEHWTNFTPFEFKTYEGESDYISFEPNSFNDSLVGRHGGKQVVNIIPTTSVGWVVHEIGHVIGLWHEHSRPDQEDNIEILWDNISANDYNQFRPILTNNQVVGPYDYSSIMHYPDTAFSENGQLTIRRKDGGHLGPRNGLSPGDLLSCRHLYPDIGW
ncbi:M12 family metallopeptidase [Marinicella meishanensis]|uniref:M12 family metallopeptidase n=1 Tax=Marinicella meishanensis TaxID=2873263 RepID=UPI001CC04DCB|nr:M12 family metallopeptidase [Marinicella sp. NBU2979]